MYEIKFKDTNPDTGVVVLGYTLATCQNGEFADYLCELIQKNYADIEQDPNREFYVQYNPDLTLLVI
jgi:protein-disulfide isomerase